MKYSLIILFILASCGTAPVSRKVDIKLYKPSKVGLERKNTKTIPYSDMEYKNYFCVDKEDLTEMFNAIKGY